MAAYYALSDEQVLKMPIKRFWLFHQNIDRIKAGDDIRAIAVSASVLSAEQYTKTIEGLLELVGVIIARDQEVGGTRDVAAIEELKRILKK